MQDKCTGAGVGCYPNKWMTSLRPKGFSGSSASGIVVMVIIGDIGDIVRFKGDYDDIALTRVRIL